MQIVGEMQVPVIHQVDAQLAVDLPNGEKQHPVLRKYLDREERICNEILKNLSKTSSKEGQQRAEEIKEERRLIQAAMALYESKGTDGMDRGEVSAKGSGRLG